MRSITRSDTMNNFFYYYKKDNRRSLLPKKSLLEISSLCQAIDISDQIFEQYKEIITGQVKLIDVFGVCGAIGLTQDALSKLTDAKINDKDIRKIWNWVKHPIEGQQVRFNNSYFVLTQIGIIDIETYDKKNDNCISHQINITDAIIRLQNYRDNKLELWMKRNPLKT